MGFKVNWQAGDLGHPDCHNAIGSRLNQDVLLTDYSATDGDWTDAINQAVSDVGTRTLVIPDGTYDIAGAVVLSCHVRAAPGATIRLMNDGAYVQCGGAVAKTLTLPRIERGNTAWHATSPAAIRDDAGLVLVGLDGCTLHIPYIADCSTGIHWHTGGGQSSAYNTLHLGVIATCAVGLHVEPTGTAWVSENYYYGGRLAPVEGAEKISGTYQLRLAQGDVPSGACKFFGLSLEGDTPEYSLWCDQDNNHFYGVRWESDAPVPHVYFGPNATGNWIVGGTAAWRIVRDDATGSAGNVITTIDRDGDHAVTVDGDVKWRAGAGPCLTAPDGTEYRLSVANDGTLSAAALH